MTTSYRRFMVCCFGVAAGLWGTAGASAQEPQATAQPEVAGSPGLAQLSGDIPWNGISWIERRYKVEAMRKTGARSQIEAIAAGLRSLRAPSPRQVEPVTSK